jgi:hypothetical protein
MHECNLCARNDWTSIADRNRTEVLIICIFMMRGLISTISPSRLIACDRGAPNDSAHRVGDIITATTADPPQDTTSGSPHVIRSTAPQTAEHH